MQNNAGTSLSFERIEARLTARPIVAAPA